MRYRILDRLGRWLPRWVDRPFVKRERLFYAALDATAGQELPPENASVEIHGLWAVEVFTAANIERLISRMKGLGWDKDEGTGIRDIVGWLRQARDGQRGIRKRRMRRTGSELGSFVWLSLPLPSFADHVVAEFETLSRSVTRLSLFFPVGLEGRQQVNAVLQASYSTEVIPRERGVSVINPSLRRREAVAALRNEWRQEIRGWLREYFPGLLACANDPTVLPTCELAVTDGFEPFAPIGPDGASRTGIAAQVQMGFASQAFEEDGRADNNLASAIFATDPFHSRALRHHSTLAIPRQRYESTVASLDEVSGEFRYAFEVDRMFRRTFSNWSLMPVVRHYETLLAAAHDGAFGLLGSRWSLRALRKLREVTARASDARTVSRELTAYADSGELSWFEGFDFVRQPHRPRDQVESILTIMRRRLGQAASNLGISVGELNDFLHQQANLLSATANLRMQWAVGLFALISVAAAILALKPTERWLGWEPSSAAATVSRPSVPTPVDHAASVRPPAGRSRER